MSESIKSKKQLVKTDLTCVKDSLTDFVNSNDCRVSKTRKEVYMVQKNKKIGEEEAFKIER